MRKRKTILIIVFLVLTIWSIFFITDSNRCKKDKDPIFCIEGAMYDDGGSKRYIGLFYNYYSLKTLNPKKTIDNDEPEYLVDKVITPWFFGIDYAKEKAFKEK